MLDFLTKSISNLFGNKSERDIKVIQPIVELTNQEFAKLSSLSNDQLRAKTAEFKKRIAEHISAEEAEIAALKKVAEDPQTDIEQKELEYEKVDAIEKRVTEKIQEFLNEILPEAFAVVKETARRFKENDKLVVTASDNDRELAAERGHVKIEGDKAIWHSTWDAAGTEIRWDMMHYDVQLIGGIVLHQGKISEMATGEGKTLVATLPLYLNALPGRGVHVVTVNNYLAKRDAEWNGPLFEFHGLSVDCIDKHEPNSDDRKKAYNADITYGTNNEFGFDYLRDNMARTPEDLVQRKHNYAIVDEVDSVLIDDARTPLIISGPTPKGDNHLFHELKPRVEKLVNAQRSYVNTILADSKKLFAEKNEKDAGLPILRAHRGLPKNKALIKFLSETGVKALLQKTESHYMQDQSKEMHKVDAELYFVIDEKNNTIELTEKGIELISNSAEDQKFFILPDIGSEIVELERLKLPDDEKLARKDELLRDYAVKAERIHSMNQLLKAYTLFEKDVEYVVMDGKIKIVDEQTGRILEGRRYSDGLHQAIESKENVKIEDSTQTYATITLQNYFRMYNKLAGMTGTAETEAGEFWDIYKLDVVVIPTNRSISRKDMEDLVYKTTREKYNAVIIEIEKLVQAGRPVLVGTTSVEISELLSRMLKLRGIKHNVLNAKLHQKEADIVAEAGKAGTVTIATNMAGRGTDIKLGAGVKDAGGLAIIGTERHESRRVDRQLRGRAGRQGDPGTSQFFVSLEDNLMRLFGSDRIAKMMDRFGIEEGEVIQHSMISKSIERAQRKVEENNFGTRKRLIEYDDVMNAQREVIYKKRRHALFGERLAIDIANTMFDVSENIVAEYHGVSDFEGFKMELIRAFGMEPPVTEAEFLKMQPKDISEKIYNHALENYRIKTDLIAERSFPVIKDVFENQGDRIENIVTPFTDGIRTLQVLVNLKQAYASKGRELALGMEKGVILSLIDDAWKEHLREMDELKQSVQHAVYEQKDPLLIYKFESFELFKQMMAKNNKDIASFLTKATLPNEQQDQVQQARAPQQQPQQKLQTSRSEAPAANNNNAQPQQERQKVEQVIRQDPKIGRNDPCPCGSGKKFKSCHGK
ncbi:MAG TPA: preprotein translocase subunit SecA [Bacteroidia bacterium]|jgi:preprotein translocase subunit SecA|nr:preprotein translocase subunit SecA [Bacteroidia bacterium]